MKLKPKILRAAAIIFSAALLAGYVVYSHVTPNTPPPDLLGVNEVESKSASASIAKGYDTPQAPERLRSDLRIISSKVINQPVFRVVEPKLPMTMPEVRVATAGFKSPGFRMVKELEIVPGPGENAAMPFGAFLSPTPDPLKQTGTIERILKDDGSAGAGSGRMQTPEKLSTDYYRALHMRKAMMSGSKSGMLRFDPSPWLDGPLLPHNPAPTVNP
jgi:hypothetical protein